MEMIKSEFWKKSRTGFDPGPLPEIPLPADYLRVLQLIGPGEGPVGSEYLRLFPLDELTAMNHAYRANDFTPGVTLFGSNVAGYAFAFDLRAQMSIVRTPFIPLHFDYLEPQAKNLAELIESLLATGETEPVDWTRLIDREGVGLELHEVKPIIFGGDPSDRNNRRWVTPRVHAECVASGTICSGE